MEDFKVWGELYRPKTIAECILPTKMKQGVVDALASGNIPSFIFAGPPGCGKTSLAYAIIGELDAEYLYINASRETSIDVIRDRVVSFCSTVSMTGTQKIVFLDEVDGLSGKALDSLKGTYEEFSHVRFILTTNSLGKVIEAIRSRSTTIEFKIDKTEKTKLSVLMMKRVIGILKERNIEFDPAVIAQLVNKYFPDFRRTLNELQMYAASGKIDSGALITAGVGSYDAILKALKDKDFKTMRLWVAENASDDSSQLFSNFYENAFDYFVPESVPQLILHLSDYQTKGADNRINPKINLAAFLVEVMVSCNFKD